MEKENNEKSYEQLLSKVLEICLKSTEYPRFVNTIVSLIGEYFDADRCFFVEHDRTSTRNLPLQDYSEWCSSEDILPQSKRPYEKESEPFVVLSREKRIGIVEDIDKINLPEDARQMLVTDLQVKSYMILPVYYRNIVYGAIVLHYVRKKKSFTKKEITVIESITNNFAIVMGQRELHSRLLEQVSREKTILENLPFPVWIKDNENYYISCNSYYLNFLNLPENTNITGKLDSELFLADEAEESTKILNYVIQNKQKFKYETQKTYNYTKKWYDITIAPFYNEKREIVGVIGFAIDITERKEITRMENEFISTISHELRTPLTSIKGALELLHNPIISLPKEKSQELITIGRDNCTRLSSLIDNLLDINKIEVGKMDFKFEKIEIVNLVKNSIFENKTYAVKHNIGLRLKTAIEECTVVTDSNRLFQVLTNLYSNAIKYSKQNTFVDIEMSLLEKFIQISVTNYGYEIPKEFNDRIFSKFSQADSSITRAKGGTGLGLSISKGIIEKLGGTIDFTSENNQTTFYITIPRSI